MPEKQDLSALRASIRGTMRTMRTLRDAANQAGRKANVEIERRFFGQYPQDGSNDHVPWLLNSAARDLATLRDLDRIIAARIHRALFPENSRLYFNPRGLDRWLVTRDGVCVGGISVFVGYTRAYTISENGEKKTVLEVSVNDDNEEEEP